MTERRKRELTKHVTGMIAQEARHLADTADYDEVSRSDEEDEFIREELRRQADVIDMVQSVFRRPT